MDLLLKRKHHNMEATLGHLSIDGRFQCHTLEDQPQEGKKIPGETRIPAGRYEIKLRQEGGMYKRYKNNPAYKPFFVGHLWLQNVNDFEWIYLHVGNNDDHTSGCILVGTGWTELPRMQVLSSRVAYRILYRRIIAAVQEGDCWITVEDEDGFATQEEETPVVVIGEEGNFEDTEE